MTSTSSTLEIIARFSDNASGGITKAANAARSADKAFESMAQKLEFQNRAASLAAQGLQTAQNAYTKSAQKANELEAALQKTIAAEGKESTASLALASQLERLAVVNDKLAQSVQRKQLALDKSIASITKTRDESAAMGQSLTKQAQQVEQSGSAFAGLGTKLAGLGAAYLGLSAIAGKAIEGFQLGATLDQNRRTLGTLLQDVEKGNAVFAEAIAFGQKYGYTQQEMGSAVAGAAGIIKNSNQTTEKTLEVLGRLASLNPAEGIEGATVAIKELASGDIVSLAERFNISKTAANAMKDAIVAGADPIQVLDAALSGMGVSADVLSQRMEGANGALLRNKLAGENLMLSLGSLLQAFGATYLLEAFAAGLNTIATGLNFVATSVASFLSYGDQMTATMADGAARMLENGRSYEQYAAAMNSVGESASALTASEYAMMDAMIGNGMAARDAFTAVQQLGDVSGTLTAVLHGQAEATGMSADAQAALIERTMELGAATPEAATAVALLVEELNASGDIEAFTSALALQSEQMMAAEAAAYANAEATFYNSEAQVDITNTALAAADATYALTDEQLANAVASQEAELATALLAERQAQMEQVVRSVELGFYSEAQAAAVLASQFNISNAEAVKFLNTQLQLNAALGRQRAIANFGNVLNAGGRAAEAKVREIERPARSSGRGRSGGGGGAGGGAKTKTPPKSEAVKQAEADEKALDGIRKKADQAVETYQQKREALEKSHAEKIAAINADAQQKQLAATQQFNEDKFNLEVGFKESIVAVDQDLWDQANAAENDYWAKSQEMAQAGHAEQAQAYYEAGTAYAQLVAENAQEIRDLQQQVAEEEDAVERARLEQRLAREREINAQQEQLAKDRVTAVETSGDAIEQERKDQIDKENADYSDSQQELKAAIDESFSDIKDSYEKIGGAARAAADSIVAAAKTATDAINAIPSAPSGGSSDASSPPPEARAMGGPVRRGTPYWVGEHAPELFVPRQSGQIMNQQQLRSSLTSGVPALSRAAPITNTSSTFAPSVSIDMRGASGPIAQTETRIRQMVRNELKSFNEATGRKALNGKRS